MDEMQVEREFEDDREILGVIESDKAFEDQDGDAKEQLGSMESGSVAITDDHLMEEFREIWDTNAGVTLAGSWQVEVVETVFKALKDFLPELLRVIREVPQEFAEEFGKAYPSGGFWRALIRASRHVYRKYIQSDNGDGGAESHAIAVGIDDTYIAMSAPVEDLIHEIERGCQVVAVLDTADDSWDITGVDRSDSANPQIIVNANGYPNDTGYGYSIDEFISVWEGAEIHYVAIDETADVAPSTVVESKSRHTRASDA